MPPHVLVVDDEESIRYTFRHFLTEQGYTVSCAADYGEGIALLRENGCDLVFADIILPGRSGIDLLKEAKENFPDVVVIMITGAPSVESAAECLRVGAILVWPVMPRAAERLWAKLGLEGSPGDGPLAETAVFGTFPATTVAKGDPLFPRVEA